VGQRSATIRERQKLQKEVAALHKKYHKIEEDRSKKFSKQELVEQDQIMEEQKIEMQQTAIEEQIEELKKLQALQHDHQQQLLGGAGGQGGAAGFGQGDQGADGFGGAGGSTLPPGVTVGPDGGLVGPDGQPYAGGAGGADGFGGGGADGFGGAGGPGGVDNGAGGTFNTSGTIGAGPRLGAVGHDYDHPSRFLPDGTLNPAFGVGMPVEHAGKEAPGVYHQVFGGGNEKHSENAPPPAKMPHDHLWTIAELYKQNHEQKEKVLEQLNVLEQESSKMDMLGPGLDASQLNELEFLRKSNMQLQKDLLNQELQLDKDLVLLDEMQAEQEKNAEAEARATTNLVGDPFMRGVSAAPRVMTILSDSVAAGATTLQVESMTGFNVGDTISIGSERHVIRAFGSMVLASPLASSYPKGTAIFKETQRDGDTTGDPFHNHYPGRMGIPGDQERDGLWNDPFLKHAQPADDRRNDTPVYADPWLNTATGNQDHRHRMEVQGDPTLTSAFGNENQRNSMQVQRDPWMNTGTGNEDQRNRMQVQRDPWLNTATGNEDQRNYMGVQHDPWGNLATSNTDRRNRLMVDNDPFLTHQAPIVDREMLNVGQDPMLTHSFPVGQDQRHVTDLERDPFMTHNEFPAGTRAPLIIANDPFMLQGQRPAIPANVAADPFLTKDPHMKKNLAKDAFLVHTIPNQRNDAVAHNLDNDPWMAKSATLLVDVGKGAKVLEVSTIEFFRKGQAVCINPGGDNEEVCVIAGFGSIHLKAATTRPHFRGESIVPVTREPRYTFDERMDDYCGITKAHLRNCEFGVVECFGRTKEQTGRMCALFGHEIGMVPTDFVIRPWLVFLLFMLVGCAGRHFYPRLSSIGFFIFGFCCSMMIVSWFTAGQQLRTLKVANSALLCFIAMIGAAGLSSVLWNYALREYWWLNTGITYDTHYHGATMPASSMADAAWIRFQTQMSPPSNDTMPVMVDNTRAAGYRDGHMFCAAPVLSAEALMGNNALTLVQYWVIGMDCCQNSGSFTCDDSRRPSAEYAISVVGEGLPCAGCNKDRFREAIKKAEALHGLVTADGALLVRWVSDPSKIREDIGVNICVCGFVITIISLWAVVGAAWLLFRIEKGIWERLRRHADVPTAHDADGFPPEPANRRDQDVLNKMRHAKTMFQH